MATTTELLELERQALIKLTEARGKYEESVASGAKTAKELQREQKGLTTAISRYRKASLRANKARGEEAKLTEAQNSHVKKARVLYGAMTVAQRGAAKSTSLNADAIQDLVTAGIGLFGMAAVFKKVGNMYEKFVMPLDQENLKLAESFGNVRDASGGFATNMGAQVAQETDSLRQKILGLKVGLDGTTDASTGLLSPLRFLSPGMKGVKEAAEATTKTFISLADKTAALVQGFDKSAENVLIFKKILNATDEDVGVFADRSIVMGTTIEAQMAAAAKATQKFSQNFGVNQKVLSTTVNTLRKDFVGFATFSEEQLAKVAATALKLGVSLEGIKKLNMFDNFDQAAEKAAMLGQAFGINVDAFDLFAEQDPAERLRMLQEAATDAGVDVTQLGRIGLNYFADLTGGMNPQDVLKAFSPGNIGRFEEGITAAAATPAATMEQQQQQLVKLNQQLTKNASTFFSDFSNMIPQAVSTYAERLQAIEDSVFAGGTRPQAIRRTFAGVAGTTGGVAATFGGEGADAVINKHLGELFKISESATKHVDKMVSNTGPLMDSLGTSITASDSLTVALEGATNQVMANSTVVTDAVSAAADATAELSLFSQESMASLNALGEDTTRAIDNITVKAASLTETLVDAAGGSGTTAAGLGAADRAMKRFDRMFGTTFQEQMTRLVDSLLPELLKKIQQAGNDVAMNDGITGMRDGFDASPMTIVTSGGKRIVTANNDEALIGQKDGMIQSIVETARESMRAARTITASSPMAMVGNQLAPETSRLTNEDQTVVVNLNLEMPVDFGDVRTQAVLTKATLSGQVEGANASLRQILERPNPEGVSF